MATLDDLRRLALELRGAHEVTYVPKRVSAPVLAAAASER